MKVGNGHFWVLRYLLFSKTARLDSGLKPNPNAAGVEQFLSTIEADDRSVDSEMTWRVAADHKLLTELNAGLYPDSAATQSLVWTTERRGNASLTMGSL
jgi:hypothetical protein